MPKRDDNATQAQPERLEFERERWVADLRLRDEELRLKRIEVERSRWNNPLTIAILGAALAGIANAGVASLNGYLQRRLESDRASQASRLEDQKSQASLILEVIKIGDPDKAAVNLKFLLDTGLLSSDVSARLDAYLRARKPGEGAVLPAPLVPLQPSDFVNPSNLRQMWICGALSERSELRDVRDKLTSALRAKFPTAMIAVGDELDQTPPRYTINISDQRQLQSAHKLELMISPEFQRVVVFMDRGTERWGLDKELTISIDTALKAASPSECELVYG